MIKSFDDMNMATFRTLMDVCQLYNITVIFETSYFVLEKRVRLDRDPRHMNRANGWRTYTKTYETLDLNNFSTFEELIDNFLNDFNTFVFDIQAYEGGYKENTECTNE